MANTNKNLILSDISLSVRQQGIINTITPKEFVKTRPGKKGKKFTYVEGGYVVSKLNEAFSPIGWDFEIIEQGIINNDKNVPIEVWVKGKITVIDHKRGYRVSKTQYGAKTHYPENIVGDTLKSASTDCLKKCASLFGIALDIYWTQLDGEKPADKNNSEKPKVVDSKIVDQAIKLIKTKNSTAELINIKDKIEESSIYTAEHKKKLISAISIRIDVLLSNEK